MTGILVDQREELATAMMFLAQDPGVRAKMAAAAVQSASRYDIESTVRRTLALYEELQDKSAGLEAERTARSRNSLALERLSTAWRRSFRHRGVSRGH